MPKRRKKRNYYPAFLDISRRKCLVIGGGKVAERKVERLLKFRAKLRIVSPKLTPRLLKWAELRRFGVVFRVFRPSDLRGADLVFALTDRPVLNRSIARAAQKRKIWVNVAKPGEASDFILPALLERPSFTVAVSTRGRSPARARKLKARLEKLL